MCAFVLSHSSYALFFATLWTLACQSPPSIGFSRQECWVGCHVLLQGVFQILGLKLHLLCFLLWQSGLIPSDPLGKPIHSLYSVSICITAFRKIVSINDVLEDLMCHGRQNYSLHVNTSNFSKLWMIIWWKCLIKKWIFRENIEKPAKTRVYIYFLTFACCQNLAFLLPYTPTICMTILMETHCNYLTGSFIH